MYTPSPRMLKAVFPGKYIQAERALEQLPALAGAFGSKTLILASPHAMNHILPASGIDLHSGSILTEEFRRECSAKEIDRVREIIRRKGIEVLAALGGGKTIDTAKIAADLENIPVIIIPAIASTDAPCSGCAVVYTDEGVFDHVHYQKMNPQVVLVDMDIIAVAPVRFLVSGMGDALATWFEARSCDRSQSPNACGGYSTLTGISLARLCYETLLKYGTAAKTANEQHIVTPALHHIVEANTLLSGLGFESAGLAAAHAIHNGLTVLPETHRCFHGEKVAFGVVTGLHLTDASPEEMDTVYGFCEEIGLPVTFAGLGITDTRRERLMEAAIKACDPAESIHHEAGTITPGMVLNAMIAANAMGENRRSHPVSPPATGGIRP